MKRILEVGGFFCFGLAGLLILGSYSCSSKKSHPDGTSINYNDGLSIANRVSDDLVEDNSKDLFGLLDEGFTTRVANSTELEKSLQDMYAQYGKPVRADLKACEIGYRADGTYERPRRSYVYACQTTKYALGSYFVKVEVVPARDFSKLVTSGFGIITYPKGIPAYLK
jgi:hypothetical protein